MTTFFVTLLKIAAVAALVVLAFYCWPAVFPLVVLGGLGLLAAGALAAVGVTVALTVVGALIGAAIVTVLALGVSLAPLWVPVLIVLGIVALVRAGSRRTT